MIIGLDFDNTLVCYDSVFREIAKEKGLDIAKDCPSPKKQLQSELRKQENGEVKWTEVQASAYGPKIHLAKPFPGLVETLANWKKQGHHFRIISHKTQYPTLGPLHDLREGARSWIQSYLSDFLNLSKELFFESTQQSKIARIESEGCDVFIDDLQEILSSKEFPKSCTGILFDPNAQSAPRTISSWGAAKLPKIEAKPPSQVSSETKPFVLESHLPREYHDQTPTPSELSGGKNSEVLRLDFEGQPSLILKQYPRDGRFRVERESDFLAYLETIENICTPRLVTTLPEANRTIITYINGEPLNPSSAIPREHWLQCLNFIETIQQGRNSQTAKDLRPATDAAFSLQSHLGITTRRRNQCLERAQQEPDSKLSRWIKTDLENLFQKLARCLIGLPSFKTELPNQDRILSPSDFGLHNALLQSDARLAYYDFEYAGWDDPAKTWSDFFLQPRFPAPHSLRTIAADQLTKQLKNEAKDAFIERLPFVFACCSLNWIYIILNRNWSPQTPCIELERLKNELAIRADEALNSLQQPKQFCESTL